MLIFIRDMLAGKNVLDVLRTFLGVYWAVNSIVLGVLLAFFIKKINVGIIARSIIVSTLFLCFELFIISHVLFKVSSSDSMTYFIGSVSVFFLLFMGVQVGIIKMIASTESLKKIIVLVIISSVCACSSAGLYLKKDAERFEGKNNQV